MSLPCQTAGGAPRHVMAIMSTMPSIDELERHRAAITGHCYRMLGSVLDADDAVQETMVRAWRGLAGLDEQAALPGDADPHERVALQQSLRLAFIAALQHLPSRQRAVLLLVEVLGWSAAEVANGLEMTVAAVNSALQRARATLASRDITPTASALSSEEHALVDRYVHAFERYDVDALAALMHEDATMSMPPYSLWLRGAEAMSGWMLGRGAACRGSILVPTAANGLPAFGQYKPAGDGRYEPWALVVLEIERGAIASHTFFLDTATLFPRFSLALALEARPTV